MKFLITGSAGQLGREFVARFERDAVPYAAPAESQLDITKRSVVLEAVAAHRPDVVLNCAAYNQVDKAETDPEQAFAVNATAVANLASVCRQQGILLVHYSSDYVFDGTKEGWYTEADVTNPLNAYGRSKLEGERFAAETENLVLRVSWVFGPGEQNFLYKLEQWAARNEVLKVVWDQISVPTYTADIVEYSLRVIAAGHRGTFHLTNSGYASRYEVARFFLELLGHNKVVLPVNSSQFASTVKRPFFSAMTSATLQDKLSTTIPSWQDALQRYVTHSKRLHEHLLEENR